MCVLPSRDSLNLPAPARPCQLIIPPCNLAQFKPSGFLPRVRRGIKWTICPVDPTKVRFGRLLVPSKQVVILTVCFPQKGEQANILLVWCPTCKFVAPPPPDTAPRDEFPDSRQFLSPRGCTPTFGGTSIFLVVSSNLPSSNVKRPVPPRGWRNPALGGT